MEDNTTNFSFPILLIDEECQLCVRFKTALQRLEGTQSINIQSVHEQAIYDKFPFLEKEECKQQLHLIISRDKILKGPDAIASLIVDFPMVKNFSWLIESQMGQKAVDYFYTMANKYRQSLLNRCPSCK